MLRLGFRRLLPSSLAGLQGSRSLLDGNGVRLMRTSSWMMQSKKSFENYRPKEKQSDEKRDGNGFSWRMMDGGKGEKKEGEKKEEKSGRAGGGGGGGRGPGSEWNDRFILFGLGGLVTYFVLRSVIAAGQPGGNSLMDHQQIDWQHFKTSILPEGQVQKIMVINNDRANVYTKNGGPNPTYSFSIGSVDSFEMKLQTAQEDLNVNSRDFIPVFYSHEGSFVGTLISWLPTILLVGSYMFIMRRMGGGAVGGPGGGEGGQGGIFNVGKAKTIVMNKDNNRVATKFKDVAGLDEAKVEVTEFVEYLKNPERYKELGAKIPKGALLHGPPGTGKTLLAKATAGESGVPFLSISGSDFMEMFVGVGPSRVRDLFQQARQHAPCIIFIDEIDAIGRSRGRGGLIGGNDERENTLNQLLVEMDGFQTNSGVVVLAGTNRVDVLDQALLRPGRFDRQIVIDNPDIKGRRDIFMVHLRKVMVADPPGKEAVARQLSARTPGFSGAQIANVCNEAALIAARHQKESVELEQFESALDRVIGGLEKKNLVMSPEEKRTVAYHEAGHAVTGWFLEHALPLLKVSIVPRGEAALGYAQYQPQERYLMSSSQLSDMMCMALGGRAAEEIFFKTVTTGAADDFRKVTQMAYQSIAQYGFGQSAGLLSFPTPDSEQSVQFTRPYSNHQADEIDKEVRQTVGDLYEKTKQLLINKRQQATQVAELLLEREVIGYDDMVRILGKREFEDEERTFEQITDAAIKADKVSSEKTDSDTAQKAGS